MVGLLMRPLSESRGLMYSVIIPTLGPVITIGTLVSDTNGGHNMVTDFQIELMLAIGLVVWGYIVFIRLQD